jgi:O-antigen/teichoic acid export membrane protein
MAEPNSSFRLLGNSAWNAAAFLLGVGLNLLILPFVVSRLELPAFGVAGLVAACVAPAMAFSNSLALSTTRELAQRLAPDKRDDARRFFATASMLALGIGGLIAATLCLAGPPLARLAFHLGGKASDDLGLAFTFGAGGWLCQCLSAVFLALFTARQDYFRIGSINIFSTIVMTLAILVFIPRWPQASTYLACQALGFATGLLAAVALSRWAIGEWPARPALYGGPFSDLVSLGVWQLVAQGSGVIAGQADRYLLGALLAPQFVGFYTIAQRLEEAMYIGILKIGEILFPFFSVLQKESSERKADLLFRASWVLNVLAACALGALVPIAGPLLHLWTGSEVAAEAQRVLVVLTIAGMLGCSANVFVFYLLANGKSRSTALLSFVTAVFTLATSAVALPYFGWQGAGWSACVGMMAQIVATIILLRQDFNFAGMWPRVAHFVLLPLVTGVVTALVLRHFIDGRHFDEAPLWWYVGGLYGLAAGVIFVVVVFVSGLGPHGAACWRDLRVIASRFLPVKAT